MPRTQAVQVAKTQTSGGKHHGEKCKITDHETICLEDRSMSGHSFSTETCKSLGNVTGCEWNKTFHQKPIHVPQKPILDSDE